MRDKILDVSKIEKLVRDKGLTNLQWCSGDNELNPFFRRGKRYFDFIPENVRFILMGYPEGKDENFMKAIVVEIRNKNYIKTIGYKFVKGQMTKKYVREGD